MEGSGLIWRWWRSIDRCTLSCGLLLIVFGFCLMLAASRAVAIRIGAAPDLFIWKQVFFLSASALLMITGSLLTPRQVRFLALIGCGLGILLTAMTLFKGMEIKGARRWIALSSFSLQPSEFLKPCFAVVAGWLFSFPKNIPPFPLLPLSGRMWAFLLFFLIAIELLKQPDIGMLSVITLVLFVQLFLDGIPLWFFGILVGMAATALVAAYNFFPHVHSRIQRFLHPGTGDHYQIQLSLDAFARGGLWGRGAGEGHIKDLIPDAHADFVFSVAGEEFGVLACLGIIFVFATLVVISLQRLIREERLFPILAGAGLVSGLGIQAAINMGSAMQLIPTKGMTLPFISYGGSSALSVGLTMGLLLALTRRQSGTYGPAYERPPL